MQDFFVPNDILRVFRGLYPNVDLCQVEWSWEVPGKIYEADFELNGHEYEVEITVTGHHLLTEIEGPEASKLVRNVLAELYPDHSVDACTWVHYSNGDLSFEFELTSAKDGREFEVHLREDGQFLLEGIDL